MTKFFYTGQSTIRERYAIESDLKNNVSDCKHIIFLYFLNLFKIFIFYNNLKKKKKKKKKKKERLDWRRDWVVWLGRVAGWCGWVVWLGGQVAGWSGGDVKDLGGSSVWGFWW